MTDKRIEKEVELALQGSTAPALGKGFYLACQDIAPNKNFVVDTGRDKFPMGENITAISLIEMMETLLPYRSWGEMRAVKP